MKSHYAAGKEANAKHALATIATSSQLSSDVGPVTPRKTSTAFDPEHHLHQLIVDYTMMNATLMRIATT